jgi:CDP-diacylglycerol--inositol 3-phosphatidyltransferase
MKWTATPIGFQSLDFVPSLVADLTYAQAIAAFCAPIFLLKNIINMVQLWKASKILVGVDLAERAEAKKRA